MAANHNASAGRSLFQSPLYGNGSPLPGLSGLPSLDKIGGVQVVAAETEGRVGKVEGQPAHTREVKLGCVFTQAATDEQGRPVRDEDCTTYTAAI